MCSSFQSGVHNTPIKVNVHFLMNGVALSVIYHVAVGNRIFKVFQHLNTFCKGDSNEDFDVLQKGGIHHSLAYGIMSTL